MEEAPVGHHCPSCVAEAKREFRRGPGRRIAVANAKALSVTRFLLGVIGIVYIVETVAGGSGSLVSGPSANQLVKLGAAVAVWPSQTGLVGIATGQYWRLFTAMFLHIGLLHIAFNGYALWVFGSQVEQELGRLRFLTMYLVTGLCASAVSFALAEVVVAGNGRFTTLISPPAAGASGAIFGIFGAFVAYNWRRRHQPLAAARLRWALTIIVINAVIGFSASGIDWHAHAGGLVAGLIAGTAAEGIGRIRNDRLTFALGVGAVLAITVGLVVWRTMQLQARFPGAL